MSFLDTLKDGVERIFPAKRFSKTLPGGIAGGHAMIHPGEDVSLPSVPTFITARRGLCCLCNHVLLPMSSSDGLFALLLLVPILWVVWLWVHLFFVHSNLAFRIADRAV
jgi:hypothetical protein